MTNVKARLEEIGYFSQGLVDNSQLLDELSSDPEVGGVLLQYMKKEKVRTYIKDCIIGKYAKAKNSQMVSTDKVKSLIEKKEQETICIEEDKNQVVIGKCENTGRYIYIAKGTVLKWESALRKLLERRSRLIHDGIEIEMFLALSNTGRKLTESEKENIAKTLRLVNVNIIIING